MRIHTTMITTTGIRTTMPIDANLLTLTQWLSPAYPVGAFAYSHGLEAAVAQAWVSDEASLQAWLTDIVTQGSGHTDAVWIWRAFEAEDVAEVDALARAYQPSAERLREAERQGMAFARTTRDVWGLDLPDLLLPVALGRAARLKGMDPSAVTALYLHSFSSNLVSAAQRLMPLGQTRGQAVLAALTPICTQTAEAAQGAEPFSNAFLSDIAAMQHETLEPRLFQS
ncbi:urease accessory protein UreF [Tropicibacter naphthalenivorans]|uniref:Urease accessory protein UreF n=1 Tax=Tropicibacter naphthalenivorans TaxID=441103 RepID=A0A0P1GIF4_9RHOB|nr:urease accessory UreF family protein [Tropicibacter naphthalenivorans]CUH75335.1 Urease accessory protein UreF [Tropicibacter naphthalenivorans]SMC45043.1 urease accessory protein [Tropicibacter naphthalenivorans]